METLNRIEIIGRIGSIRVNLVGDTIQAQMAVCTTHIETLKDKQEAISVTWMKVVATENELCPNLAQYDKGDFIHVIGRLKQYNFSDGNGIDRTGYDVIAYKLNPAKED